MAAVELFASGGTRGTSLDAIAKQIGVTKTAIIHHFKTKEGLLREVRAISDVLSAAAILAEMPSTGIDQLISLRSWGQVLVSEPGLANLDRLGVVMTIEAFDPNYSARDDRMIRYHTFRKWLVEIIERGQGDGTIRNDVNAALVATEVMGFMEGTDIQWHLDPFDVDIVATYESYFDRLANQLTQPHSKRPAAGPSRKSNKN